MASGGRVDARVRVCECARVRVRVRESAVHGCVEMDLLALGYNLGEPRLKSVSRPGRVGMCYGALEATALLRTRWL